MKRIGLVTFVLMICALKADVPRMMNYQGLLEDNQGNPVSNGNYVLTFKLYSAQYGETPFWEEVQVVNLVDGIFNVLLGDNVELPDLPLEAYLGISVNGTEELVPRKKIVSVGYAFQSDMSTTSLSADTSIYSHQSEFSNISANTQLLGGELPSYYKAITAFGHVDAVSCQPSQWTVLIEVDITIPDTMLIFSFGNVSGAGWYGGTKMLQISIYDEWYTTFYNYANPGGDVANAHHLLPTGTYHIQLYGLNMSGSVADMGAVSLYALALSPTPGNTFRAGPFPPPANAQLPEIGR